MSTPQQQPGLGGIAGGGLGGKPGEVTGLPIVGVKTLCKDKPFRVFKDSEEYSKWLVTVFDLDQQNGQPPSDRSPGDPPVGNPPGGSKLPGTASPPGGGAQTPEKQ
jgi:hypothetical protein